MKERTALAQYFSREELKFLLQKSNGQGWKAIAVNWGIIILTMVAVAYFPHPLLVLGAMGILAGRQLGLAILMHDCAHYSLFATKEINEWVGQWLCGSPLLIDLDGYRIYHLKHHQNAGTPYDPDLPNYQNYPVTRLSFLRKVLRDLSGITGFKNLLIVLTMSLGFSDYTLAYRFDAKKNQRDWKAVLRQAKKFIRGPLLVHILALAILNFFGQAWVYGLWFLTYMTVYMLVLRIRNAAEHAALPEPFSIDPRLHTRTTLASWWERLLLAPNFVNYHLEHHLLPAVPGYRLAAMHKMLRDRGVIPEGSLAKGYGDVVRILVSVNAGKAGSG